MNRRRFLSFLGVAPIAAVSAVAVARAAQPRYVTPAYFENRTATNITVLSRPNSSGGVDLHVMIDNAMQPTIER